MKKLVVILGFVFIAASSYGQCTWSASKPCVPSTATSGSVAFPDTGSFLQNFFIPPTFNRVANETNSGARIVFLTDSTHPCDGTHNNSSWTTASFGYQINISPQSAEDAAAGTYYIITQPAADANQSWAAPCLITFNYNTFQVTARTSMSALNFGLFGSFNQQTPHIYYSPGNATSGWAKIYSADVSNLGAGATLLVDLSSGANCPNIGSLTTTTNGEITRALGIGGIDRFVYWGNGSQDSAATTWIYDGTKGCMWLNWSTGDINAAAGWGMNTTTCSACIPATYLGAHVHRSYIDADGDYVITENNTPGTDSNGPILFQIPAAGTWPSGSSMFSQCLNAGPQYCGNHKAFYPGHFMVNGSGLLANGFGQLSDRIRLESNLNSTSTCGKDCKPVTGYSDLLDTFNIGIVPTGNASHDASASADSAVSNYFLECSYMAGAGVAHVQYPWQQECDLVSPDPSNQNRWRLFATHLKSQVGSLTAGLAGGASGVSCDSGGNCTVTTLGPHGFSVGNTINAYNGNPSSLNAASSTGAITVATAPTTTSFTYSGGPPSVTGDAMYANPAGGASDFYAQALPQLAPNGRIATLPENSERSTPGDPYRVGLCGSSHCSQLNLVLVDAGFQTGNLTVTPSPIAFNPQQDSTTSSPVTVTLTNISSSPQTLTSELMNAGTQYTISNNNCGTSTLSASGGTCTLQISFTPTSPNSQNDTLQIIASGDPGSPYSIQATGTGLAVPVISPTTGSYSGSQVVSITDSTTGATIYYTTNGVTPTCSSTQYTSPFTISSTTTVEAIACLGGASTTANTSVITITGGVSGNLIIAENN